MTQEQERRLSIQESEVHEDDGAAMHGHVGTVLHYFRQLRLEARRNGRIDERAAG